MQPLGDDIPFFLLSVIGADTRIDLLLFLAAWYIDEFAGDCKGLIECIELEMEFEFRRNAWTPRRHDASEPQVVFIPKKGKRLGQG